MQTAVTGTRDEPSERLPDGIIYAKTGTDAYRDLLSQANTIAYLAHASKPARHGDGLSYEFETNVAAMNGFVHDLSVEGFSGQLFYTSSGGQVYGGQKPTPSLETDTLQPRTAYGFGKLMCEEIVQYASRVSGLNAAILRIANPVGKGQIGTGHGLVGAIFKALRDDVPMSLFGSGNNHRDYFAADDLGRFLVKLHHDGWRGDGIYNIGSGIGYTELDVFEAVRAEVGRAPEIIFKEPRAFDLSYAVVDPSKAVRQLGWDATESLQDLIRGLVETSLELEKVQPKVTTSA